MYTELELEYYKYERMHEEKFGEPPYFMGTPWIDPSADGERYIDLINEAIRKNKPVNELKDAPAHLQSNKLIW